MYKTKGKHLERQKLNKKQE